MPHEGRIKHYHRPSIVHLPVFQSDMSVFHLNIRRLNANHGALCQYLQILSFKFEIIILSEIWSYNIEFYGNILPGYTFHYVIPSSSSVGGIGMYIKVNMHK